MVRRANRENNFLETLCVRNPALVPVFPSKRKPALAVFGVAQQCLANGDVPSPESRGRTRHIKQPDAIGLLRNQFQQRDGISLQSFHPASQRKFIMFAQVLDVAYFKTSTLRGFQGLRDGDYFTIRKNILVK